MITHLETEHLLFVDVFFSILLSFFTLGFDDQNQEAEVNLQRRAKQKKQNRYKQKFTMTNGRLCQMG